MAVVRYFGGVKLGAGGLTRAYGNIARQVIEIAALTDYIEMAQLQLTLEYNQLQLLEYQIKKLDGEVLKQDFAAQVRTLIKLPKKNLTALSAIFQ